MSIYFKAICVVCILLSCQSTRKQHEFVSIEPTKKTIELVFVGDVLLHQKLRQREAATNEGYAVIWSEVQDHIQNADIAYANLEGPVAPEIGGVSGYPAFNYPVKIIESLKSSGFDLVSTANNHSLDRGSQGINVTISNLKKFNLFYTGTRTSGTEEDWFSKVKIDQKKYILYLACTEMTNGYLDKKNQVLNCYQHKDEILKIIKDHNRDPNMAALILLPHWGEEDIFSIDEKRRNWAHEMLQSGATSVVGCHPHVIQKIEELTTADGRETMVLYSLGNFISNQSKVKNKLSMILKLKLQAQENKPYTLVDVKALPLWMQRQAGENGTYIYRLKTTNDLSEYSKEAAAIWNENIGRGTF